MQQYRNTIASSRLINNLPGLSFSNAAAPTMPLPLYECYLLRNQRGSDPALTVVIAGRRRGRADSKHDPCCVRAGRDRRDNRATTARRSRGCGILTDYSFVSLPAGLGFGGLNGKSSSCFGSNTMNSQCSNRVHSALPMSSTMKKFVYLLSASTALSGAAIAQEAPAAPSAPVADAADVPDTIVVTGTLLRRKNTETPSPVTVLSSED